MFSDKVFIIVPTYNRRSFLPILIHQFSYQTYPSDLLNMIILDDSDDSTYFSVISDNIDLLFMLKDIYSDFVYDTDDIKINDRLKLKFNGYINRLIN